MIRKDFLKKLLSNTFHFAYAKLKKSLRAAYATFPPPCFRLRMTYASLARPCAHQGFQRLFLMPYAEACAPLAQPFRPRCLSSNFSMELTHCLRGACATLTPAMFTRKCLRHACALLARPSARHVVTSCLFAFSHVSGSPTFARQWRILSKKKRTRMTPVPQ